MRPDSETERMRLRTFLNLHVDRALWINGAGGELIDGSLESFIRAKRQVLRREISALEEKASRYHTKTIKGNTYWYFVEAGKWKFSGKEDPRPEIMRQAKEIESRIKPLEERMRSCIIKRLDQHLVIDLGLFKKNVCRDVPERIVPVSRILEG
jgi:hypothetical protein